MIRTLLVDDEPLAREGLRARLSAEPDIEIVGEAEDGAQAVREILTARPDLVFLDVQMPGMDGFRVLEEVSEKNLPLIIFVTAFDEYAVRAFEVNAVDYLMKPVMEARLREAVARIRRRLSGEIAREAREGMAALLDARDAVPSVGAPAPWLRRLAIKDGERFIIVKTDEIEWIGASGNYAELHWPNRSALVRMTLNDLESRLDPERFARIHRSTMVNLERIREIVPEWHGDSEVVLQSGTSRRMSRTYRNRLFPSDPGHRPSGAKVSATRKTKGRGREAPKK